MKKCIKMYDNAYKNPISTSLRDLENFLQLIADLEEEIELYALGGTAMVLAGIKESTSDIDFLTTLDYNRLKTQFTLAGLKETDTNRMCNKWLFDNKIRIDLFYNGYFIGIQLKDDWKKLSKHIRDIGKIRLFTLNWYDIIITKIGRSEDRDIDDILDIMRSQHIEFDTLKKRYYETNQDAISRDHDYNFKRFERKYKENK